VDAYLRVPDNAVSLQPFTDYFRVTLRPVSMEFGLGHALFSRREHGDLDEGWFSSHVRGVCSAVDVSEGVCLV
jgi:hypothetical protein